VVHHRVRGADHFSATSFSPNDINWGHYSELRVRDLLNQAQESFDSEQQTELLAQAHAIVVDDAAWAVVVDDAAWAFIVHDLNPRAIRPRSRASSQRRAGIRISLATVE
jgi:peptide/nickel transport system substrate-binding protein